MTPRAKIKAGRKISRKPRVISKAKRGNKLPKIRKDPLKEYAETICKDGVVEVVTLADDDCLAYVKKHISTQSLELDRLLNGLGIPCGRVTELIGPPHIGKSTLLDHIFAKVQKIGGVAVLADTEGARDSTYSRNIGVDISKLQYLQFPRKESSKDGKIVIEEQLHLENVLTKILESIDFWSKHHPDTPVVIGLDALAGTATKDELANRLAKEDKPAAAAKILRKICRQFPNYLGNTNIAVVMCNHEYQRINMGGRVGPLKETYGGDAVRHLASIRLSLYPGGDWVKRSDGVILGRVIRAKLIKNRLGNAWGEARVALISGVGVNNVWNIYEKLKEAKLSVKSGSWRTINLDGELIKFQGWTGLQQKCEEDPKLFQKLVSVYKSIP